MKEKMRSLVICRGIFAAVLLVVLSGCANQSFKLTGSECLNRNGMQHMVLRPTYAPEEGDRIPIPEKEYFERDFTRFSNMSVRVIGNQDDITPEGEYYYLDVAVSKYRPGCPILRFLITPVIFFGLGGSYVNVDFAVSDPETETALGNGIVRKANLWGGFVGLSITAESQFKVCPKEIMTDLDEFCKENAK